MTRIRVLALLMVVVSSAEAQVLLRPVVKPPPVTLEGLKQLQGKPPTGPCALPKPDPAQAPARYLDLPDTSRLELAAGWEPRPLLQGEEGYFAVRLAAPDSTHVRLSRQRNGAHGRTSQVNSNGEDAKGQVCTIVVDSVGAIWDLYDPYTRAIPRPYSADGAVVTHAGRWYNVELSSPTEVDRNRAVSTITALLVRQHVVLDTSSPPVTQPLHSPLFDLAQAWRGPGATPSCEDKGIERHCLWPAPNPGSMLDSLPGTFSPEGSVLLWHRKTASRAEAQRILDSLNAAFKQQGLEHFRCQFSGDTPAGHISSEMWEEKHLAVNLARIVPDTGGPKLLITVLDHPEQFPAWLCNKISDRVG